MQVAFCANCGKYTGHKRNVGVIGMATALATVGANYLLYSPRCVICGLTTEQAHAVTTPTQRFCTGCGKPSTTPFCIGCGTARK